MDSMNKELIETLEKLAKEFEQKGKETKDSGLLQASFRVYEEISKHLVKVNN